MKLPLLIKTKQQLRKILRKGKIENLVSWDRLGPCADFVKSVATQITVNKITYIVFIHSFELVEFHKKLIIEDQRRK
ncbi:hypothetical protein LCGC14_2237360 [marine sediment metagenome]|uniref:Uncharacterized protein n=1 Tax=marine sediment metagenome TaxID=412755 RepID=A0A0F9D6L4_9ZZZZ